MTQAPYNMGNPIYRYISRIQPDELRLLAQTD